MLAGDMHMYGDSDSDSDRVRCFTCLASTSATDVRQIILCLAYLLRVLPRRDHLMTYRVT